MQLRICLYCRDGKMLVVTKNRTKCVGGWQSSCAVCVDLQAVETLEFFGELYSSAKGFGPIFEGIWAGFREREGSIFSNHQHFAVSTGICGVACPLPTSRVDKPLLSFSTFSPDLREVLPAGCIYSTHYTLPLAHAVRQLQHVYMYYISLKFELAEHILYISCTQHCSLPELIDKREKGLETEANCKRIRVTAGCKVDAHAQ